MARKGKAPPKPEVTKRRLARWQRERRWRRILVSVGGLIIIIILVVIGYGYYDARIAPPRELLSTVGGTEVRAADYVSVLRVLQLSENPVFLPEVPLNMLEECELLRQGGKELEEPIEVSDDEITEHIKGLLFPEDEEVSEEDFNERYQQLLSSYGILDEEFRWLLEYELLQMEMVPYLREQVPEVGDGVPQVHVLGILVAAEEDAQTVIERLAEGEDFAALAQELSLDEASKEEGGDLGWLPRGLKGKAFDDVAFDTELEPEEVSEPFFTAEGYWVITVVEGGERALDETMRAQLQARAYVNWLEEQREQRVVRKVTDERLEQIYQWAMAQVGQGG